PGGEAEVVLDPLRRARLAAEGAAVEGEHGEPLRPRVDRGGEPRRTGAGDHDVVELPGLEGAEEPEADRELHLARIPEELPPGTEHDRKLPGIDVEAVDQGPGAGIALGLERLAP